MPDTPAFVFDLTTGRLLPTTPSGAPIPTLSSWSPAQESAATSRRQAYARQTANTEAAQWFLSLPFLAAPGNPATPEFAARRGAVASARAPLPRPRGVTDPDLRSPWIAPGPAEAVPQSRRDAYHMDPELARPLEPAIRNSPAAQHWLAALRQHVQGLPDGPHRAYLSQALETYAPTTQPLFPPGTTSWLPNPATPGLRLPFGISPGSTSRPFSEQAPTDPRTGRQLGGPGKLSARERALALNAAADITGATNIEQAKRNLAQGYGTTGTGYAHPDPVGGAIMGHPAFSIYNTPAGPKDTYEASHSLARVPPALTREGAPYDPSKFEVRAHTRPDGSQILDASHPDAAAALASKNLVLLNAPLPVPAQARLAQSIPPQAVQAGWAALRATSTNQQRAATARGSDRPDAHTALARLRAQTGATPQEWTTIKQSLDKGQLPTGLRTSVLVDLLSVLLPQKSGEPAGPRAMRFLGYDGGFGPHLTRYDWQPPTGRPHVRLWAPASPDATAQ